MDMLTRHGSDFDAVWESYYRQTFGPKGYNGHSLSTILREHERLKSRAEQIERLDREMQLHLVYYKEHYSFSEGLDYRYAMLQNRISLMRQENKELLKLTTLEIERYLRGRSGMMLEDELYSPRMKTVHHHDPYDFELDPGWPRTREAMSRVESGWLEPLLHLGTRSVHFHPQIIHHFHHYNTADNTKWTSPRESVRFENAWSTPESEGDEPPVPSDRFNEFHEARNTPRAAAEPRRVQREVQDEPEEEESEEEYDDEFEEEIIEKQKNEPTEKAVRFDPKPSVVVIADPPTDTVDSQQTHGQTARPTPATKKQVPNDSEMYFRVIPEEPEVDNVSSLSQKTSPQVIQTKSPKSKGTKSKEQSAFRKVTPGKSSPRKADKTPKADKTSNAVKIETPQKNQNNQDQQYTTKSVSVLREEMGDKIIDGMKRNLHERLHNVRVGRPGSRIPIRSSNSEISEQIYGKYRNQRLYPEDGSSSVDGRNSRMSSSYDSPREELFQDVKRGGNTSKQDRVPNRRVKKLWYTEENRDKILKNVKQCIVKDIKFSIYSEYQKKPRRRINEW